MAQSASAILDIIAPQFQSDPNKADVIALARGRTSRNVFGDNYEYAVALRAAHMLTLISQQQSGTAGNVASKTEGDLSISFSAAEDSGGSLHLTTYGQQLKQLIRENVVGIGITGGNDVGY